MRSRSWLVGTIVLLVAGSVMAQITGDVLGQHLMTAGSGSSVTGTATGCTYCHAPHSGIGGVTPLWNQTLSSATYTPYTSSTYHQRGNAIPTLGYDSSLCLSCHDGTVAPGQTVVYGKMTMFGSMNKIDLVGAADISGQHPLQPQHPFSLTLPIQDSPDLVASLALQGKTKDATGTVSLVKGNLECTSCHDPHVQNKDLISLNFLVRDSSSGQLCLSCHDPNRTYSNQGNPILWQKNPMSQWTNSIHAMATNQVASAANVGTYSTVAKNACISCHAPHNAPGPTRLTRATNEQDCLICHSTNTNISPAAPDILDEYTKPGNVAHPVPAGLNQHDAQEDLISQKVILNNNRHATCVDCHNAHSSSQVAAFTNLPPPAIRVSQAGISGVNADGATIMNPAANQYENCLRCHGPSTGKVANIIYGYLPLRAVATTDPLNVIAEFSPTAASSHPVMYPTGTVSLAQPTLLPYMWQLNGTTQGRIMGTQIFCTDCHNSDDNREFGGTGPNGPHGSKYSHILERAYPFTQALAPGQTIASTFLYPSPDLSPIGGYALCAKCHDLTKLDQSWTQHLFHVNQGFSCSVCHTAHGMGITSSNISGQRLVNFDANVVAQNGTTPITYSYNGGADSCTLMCHGFSHNSDGTVSAAAMRMRAPSKVK
jgi:predicted CXXCH cytochrome family protein